MIKNEIRLFLSKKNLLAFFASVIVLFLVYEYSYIPTYQAYGQTQRKEMEEHTQEIDTIRKMYEDRILYYETYNPKVDRFDDLKKMHNIWNTFRGWRSLLYEYWGDWEYRQEDIRMILWMLDELLLEDPHISDLGYDIIYQGSQREWNRRMILHEAYKNAEIEEPINPLTPMGSYVVMDILGGSSPMYFLLIFLLLVWNYDIWSADFDDSTYKLIYTLPKSRKCIFFTRCLVRGGLSIIGILFVLLCFFFRGTLSFGTGFSNFVILNTDAWKLWNLSNTDWINPSNADIAVPIIKAMAFQLLLFIGVILFFFAIIQLISFAWKNGSSTIITMTVVIMIMLASVMIKHMEAILLTNNPFFMFLPEKLLNGNFILGIPIVIFMEIGSIIGVFCGTCKWMEKREII
ncbi:MAG: ABC transporter permease subunit [Lachnospiraceae bacterium]|nr:ABC transporter permease subunit [Lachnospiraceae bacterium]